MANWYRTDIRFTRKIPKKPELVKLNCIMKNIDYDFPEITTYGVKLQNWRNPMVSLQDALSVFNHLGFECEGWAVEDEYYQSYAETPVYISHYADDVAVVLPVVDFIWAGSHGNDWEDKTTVDKPYE